MLIVVDEIVVIFMNKNDLGMKYQKNGPNSHLCSYQISAKHQHIWELVILV